MVGWDLGIQNFFFRNGFVNCTEMGIEQVEKKFIAKLEILAEPLSSF